MNKQSAIPSKPFSGHPPSAPAPRYRLVIEGDLSVMRFLVDAVDLTGRLHLGQFDRVQHELIRGVEDKLYEKQEDPGKETQRDIAREYLDELLQRMRAEEIIWQGMRSRLRTRSDTLFGIFHHNDRERIAYALWKKIGNAVSVATGFAPRDAYSGPAGNRISVTLLSEDVQNPT